MPTHNPINPRYNRHPNHNLPIQFSLILSQCFFATCHHTLSALFHKQDLHRRSHLDQIAVQIIKPDHLLSPAMCRKTIDILDRRIQIF